MAFEVLPTRGRSSVRLRGYEGHDRPGACPCGHDHQVSTKRKTYRTFVVERELPTTRQVAWDTLHEMILAGIGGYETDGDPVPHGLGAVLCFSLDGLDLTETVISFEPPWRRVYELSGAPVALYQGTTAFVDQGDTCLMSWSLVIDPLPDASGDPFIAGAERFVTGFVDRLEAVVKSRY